MTQKKKGEKKNVPKKGKKTRGSAQLRIRGRKKNIHGTEAPEDNYISKKKLKSWGDRV